MKRKQKQQKEKKRKRKERDQARTKKESKQARKPSTEEKRREKAREKKDRKRRRGKRKRKDLDKGQTPVARISTETVVPELAHVGRHSEIRGVVVVARRSITRISKGRVGWARQIKEWYQHGGVARR